MNSHLRNLILPMSLVALAVAPVAPARAQSEVPPAARADTIATGRAPRLVTNYEFVERDYSGPRVGFTIAGGQGPIVRGLGERRPGRVVSQFGWHFEHRVMPVGGGPALVTEFVPLFGGVEYGTIIPSFTMAIGVRTPSGMEFGIGPSFGPRSSGAKSSLVIAAGRSLDYGGVSVPLNLALTVNPDGARLTAIAGYAIHRASRIART